MKVLGLIPARGGSKGVPRKNVKLLGGKPLLQYTADAALAATRLSRVVLSTDDQEIAAVGRACGLDVPFMRPAELARDEAPTLPVVQHAMRWLEQQGVQFDAVCVLQPTSPFRSADDIDACIERLEASDADSVVTILPVPIEYNPLRVYFCDEHNLLRPSTSAVTPIIRRQDLPRAVHRSGSIYLTRRDVVMEKDSLYGTRILGFEVDPERALNIDEPDDWKRAETQLSADMATIDPEILIAESTDFSARATNRLRANGRVILADLDRPGLLGAVRDVDVLWVRLRHHIDAEVMEHAPRLKFIVSPTTGLNHIDAQSADARGIRVLSLRGEHEFLKTVHATAEHTLALSLALIRQIPTAHTHVVNAGWDRDQFRGRELSGKTAGIIGYGRLGVIVGRLLQAFGMRVLAHDPHVAATKPGSGVELVSLSQLLEAADLVTVHVNLNAETTGLLGREFFAHVKPGAWFINTARGELVDEAALLEALQSGRLAGAALDVLAHEHSSELPNHPLIEYARTHTNLILTPHLGGGTAESMERTEWRMAQKLVEVLYAD